MQNQVCGSENNDKLRFNYRMIKVAVVDPYVLRDNSTEWRDTRIDPLKKNIQDFIGYYWGFTILFLAYMLYVELIIIVWNLGFIFNMFQVLSPAMGILFFSIGIVIGKAKQNWFMGIRTPWTLSSEVVWDKTHRLGGKVFMISGLVSILVFFFEGYLALLLIMAPIMVGSIFLVVYSYYEYRKINNKQKP